MAVLLVIVLAGILLVAVAWQVSTSIEKAKKREKKAQQRTHDVLQVLLAIRELATEQSRIDDTDPFLQLVKTELAKLDSR